VRGGERGKGGAVEDSWGGKLRKSWSCVAKSDLLWRKAEKGDSSFWTGTVALPDKEAGDKGKEKVDEG